MCINVLFNWLWPQIVQVHLDEFVVYWNTKSTCSQKDKVLPSGVAPNTIFDFPEDYNLADYGVDVPQSMIDLLRGGISKSREDCFRWVPRAFDVYA